MNQEKHKEIAEIINIVRNTKNMLDNGGGQIRLNDVSKRLADYFGREDKNICINCRHKIDGEDGYLFHSYNYRNDKVCQRGLYEELRRCGCTKPERFNRKQFLKECGVDDVDEEKEAKADAKLNEMEGD